MSPANEMTRILISQLFAVSFPKIGHKFGKRTVNLSQLNSNTDIKTKGHFERTSETDREFKYDVDRELDIFRFATTATRGH